jgi:hypothetical protein
MKNDNYLWLFGYIGAICFYTVVIFYGLFRKVFSISSENLLWPYVIFSLWQAALVWGFRSARAKYYSGQRKADLYVCAWLAGISIAALVLFVGYSEHVLSAQFAMIGVVMIVFVSPLSVILAYITRERT